MSSVKSVRLEDKAQYSRSTSVSQYQNGNPFWILLQQEIMEVDVVSAGSLIGLWAKLQSDHHHITDSVLHAAQPRASKRWRQTWENDEQSQCQNCGKHYYGYVNRYNLIHCISWILFNHFIYLLFLVEALYLTSINWYFLPGLLTFQFIGLLKPSHCCVTFLGGTSWIWE